MRNFFLALAAFLFLFTIAKAGSQPSYTVQPGDTLWEIALAHGVSWQELAHLNKIKDPTKMQAGITLRLPSDLTPLVLRSDGSFYEPSRQEKELLAKLVCAEARGESLEGQIAVAAVVLNRVRSSTFPDSIWDVIHEPGQFTPVEYNLLSSEACEAGLMAVNRALQGEDPTSGALFFYNPSTTRYRDYWKTKQVIKKIGNHNFTL
ncbi:MAG: LysM peptidoglycan-binding domain-containing protein [Firmicutes bacterium]|nr:LysM peptidoglycan-binding domain-containing protein [Bacillota bacterium]